MPIRPSRFQPRCRCQRNEKRVHVTPFLSINKAGKLCNVCIFGIPDEILLRCTTINFEIYGAQWSSASARPTCGLRHTLCGFHTFNIEMTPRCERTHGLCRPARFSRFNIHKQRRRPTSPLFLPSLESRWGMSQPPSHFDVLTSYGPTWRSAPFCHTSVRGNTPPGAQATCFLRLLRSADLHQRGR